MRVTGPFTVEAVPAPTVKSLEDIEIGGSETQSATGKTQQAMADFRHAATPLLDASVASLALPAPHEWRDELLKTGLRGKGGQHIDFRASSRSRGTRWLHADAETKGKVAERVVISFGPEHAARTTTSGARMGGSQNADSEAGMVVFAAFEFDPEAAKDIDELTKEKTGMTFLTAQMNADLLTET